MYKGAGAGAGTPDTPSAESEEAAIFILSTHPEPHHIEYSILKRKNRIYYNMVSRSLV